MIKKLILFFFSPFCAVCIMIVPDAWTLASRQGRIPEPLVRLTEKDQSADTESRAWHGDWTAIETIGANYARADIKTPWERSVSTWNRMLLAFMAPFLAFIVVMWPYCLLLMALTHFRCFRGFVTTQAQKLQNFRIGLRKHFHFVLTLWMSASYYLYRWWVLAD